MTKHAEKKTVDALRHEIFPLLTYKRPNRSDSEEAFIKRFIESIPNAQKDEYGNYSVEIGDTPETLFSAHLDTVHTVSGRQRVLVDPYQRTVFKDDKEPLGADNAAGVWLLLQLIKNKTPGLYIFHRAEESGGLGSRWIAANAAARLANIKRAIAFDRRGSKDVITHQRGGWRGCSDTFADALCTALGMGHEKCDRGSFTDTASYFELIPECTNISVGYDREHSSSETLDLNYLDALLESILKINWGALPTERIPGPRPKFESNATDFSTAYYNNLKQGRFGHRQLDLDLEDELDDGGPEDVPDLNLLQTFISKYPDAAIDLLVELGVTTEDIVEAMSAHDWEDMIKNQAGAG